jgi:WD40 repeat protein
LFNMTRAAFCHVALAQVRTIDVSAGKILEVHSFDETLVTSLTGGEEDDCMYVGLGDGRFALLDPRARMRVASVVVAAHDKKVQHIELNPCTPHLLATASNDGNVKIWDVRMLAASGKQAAASSKAKTGRLGCLTVLPHGQVQCATRR